MNTYYMKISVLDLTQRNSTVKIEVVSYEKNLFIY